jgi:hypothetical protein
LWHICQNTPHGHKRKVCYIFFKINHNMVIHQTFCFGPCNVFRQRHNRAVCFGKRQKITVSCSKFSLRKIAQLQILNACLQQISRIWVGYVNRLNGMIVGLIWNRSISRFHGWTEFPISPMYFTTMRTIVDLQST